jgi:hypothetical protein
MEVYGARGSEISEGGSCAVEVRDDIMKIWDATDFGEGVMIAGAGSMVLYHLNFYLMAAPGEPRMARAARDQLRSTRFRFVYLD